MVVPLDLGLICDQFGKSISTSHHIQNTVHVHIKKVSKRKSTVTDLTVLDDVLLLVNQGCEASIFIQFAKSIEKSSHNHYWFSQVLLCSPISRLLEQRVRYLLSLDRNCLSNSLLPEVVKKLQQNFFPLEEQHWRNVRGGLNHVTPRSSDSL